MTVESGSVPTFDTSDVDRDSVGGIVCEQSISFLIRCTSRSMTYLRRRHLWCIWLGERFIFGWHGTKDSGSVLTLSVICCDFR